MAFSVSTFIPRWHLLGSAQNFSQVDGKRALAEESSNLAEFKKQPRDFSDVLAKKPLMSGQWWIKLSDLQCARQLVRPLFFNWHPLDKSSLSNMAPRRMSLFEKWSFVAGELEQHCEELTLFNLTAERGKSWVYKGPRPASLSLCDHSLFANP